MTYNNIINIPYSRLVWTTFNWVRKLFILKCNISMINDDVFALGLGPAAAPRAKFLTTKRYTNLLCPTKAHPSFYPTSVAPEVNWSLLVVYQVWLHVVMVQVVQHAADFQDHSCKYELSRIWILLKENNDAHETQAGFVFGAWSSGWEVAAVVQ